MTAYDIHAGTNHLTYTITYTPAHNFTNQSPPELSVAKVACHRQTPARLHDLHAGVVLRVGIIIDLLFSCFLLLFFSAQALA